MKKFFVLTAVFALALGATAQTTMRITMEDGRQIDYPVSSVATVTWITSEENPSTVPSGAQAVDLGLSVKWANMNVGAESIEDYGDYFAWGETEPKDVYNWNTYFDSVNGSVSNFKKYNNNGGKTTLDPEDDAAHVNWGGSWRMPTRAEQDELRTNCTWTWTTQDGVNGYKVVGPNGNSLFLPAAGGRVEGSLDRAGSLGYYWSSSLSGSYSSNAYELDFSSGYVDWDSSHRGLGLSVRAVCP